MIYKKIVLKKDQKVFFFSDPHYGHKNIVRGETEWDLKDHGGENSVRDFDTRDQMNQAIVDGINNTVGQDDWLICLGDWSFGGIQNIWNFRKRIVCKNIIHVLGNHDEHIANNKQLPNVAWYPDLRILVDESEIQPEYSYLATSQKVFTEVYPYLELTVSDHENGNGKQTYVLFHFPLTIWNKAHHDRVHLYGHVHGGYDAPDRSMDVGIDNAFKLLGEYRPFTQKEIRRYMGGRKYIQRSHHNKNTN